MRLALLLLLVLAGCGARTRPLVEQERDATLPHPPPLDAGADAGTDASVPPLPMGCTLGPRLGPYTSDAPAFAFSLSPLEGRRGYLVGYALGWPPDERASLATIDLGLASFEAQLGFDGDQVAATSSASWIAAVSEHRGNRIDLSWIRADDSPWTIRTRTNVCAMCFGPFTSRGPVLDGSRGVIAYRTSDDVVVYAVPVGGGAPPSTRVFPDEAGPALVMAGGDLVLVTNTSDRSVSNLRYLEPDLSERANVELPIVPVGGAPGLLGRERDVLVVGRADDVGAMHLVRADESGAGQQVPLDVEPGLYVGFSVARSRGVVAATLEGTRRNYVVALRDDTLESIVDPIVFVDSARGSSYRRPATIAPHPDGFALVYGSWEEEGLYALYGRILTCRGFD